MTNPHVAQQLDAERAAAGLTREELAKRAGVGVSTVRRFEEGERDPRLGDLEKICAALGLSVVELLNRSEERRAYEARQVRFLTGRDE